MYQEELEGNDIVVNKFNEEAVRDFKKKIIKQAMMDPSMPIVVQIDSYGGNVDSFNSMLAIMKSVTNPIITVCIGKAMSAGAALLAVGDVRFCDSDARIMVHEASGGALGNTDDVKTDAKELERINLQIMTLIAERCGKTYQELKSVIRDNEGRDLYMTPQQAKDIGLIDYIGLPLVRPNVTYSVEVLPPKKRVKVEEQLTTENIIDSILEKKKKKTDPKKKKIKGRK